MELDLETVTDIKMDGENKWVEDMDSLSFVNRVPPICPLDESYFSSQLEGEKISSEEESNLVRILLMTNPQLFDGPSQTPQSSSSSTRSSVFSTFNSLKNIDEYDELKDEDKARHCSSWRPSPVSCLGRVQYEHQQKSPMMVNTIVDHHLRH